MPLALVTGANRGIGRGVAAQLVDLGYTVLLGSRDPEQGRAAADAINRDRRGDARAVPLRLDVTEPADAQAIAQLVDREHGGVLHALVNNAAVDYDNDQHVLTADLARVQRTWEVNVLAVWRLCQVLAPALRRAGSAGRVVNVSSGSGAYANLGTGTPGYSHSKAALNALTVMLADGFRDSGTRVNACGPGWVRTDMGGAGATRSVAEGAASVVWGVTLPADGPTGGFFRDGERVAW